MNIYFNDTSAIHSEAGKIAKQWAVEAIWEALSGDYNFCPRTFLQNKIAAHYKTPDAEIGVYQRYWIYLGLLAVGLGDEFYKTLQVELLTAYEFYSSQRNPDIDDGFVFEGHFYTVKTDGSLLEYEFASGCGSRFLDELHDYLGINNGFKNYTIRVLEMLSRGIVLRITKNPEPPAVEQKPTFTDHLRKDANTEYKPE